MLALQGTLSRIIQYNYKHLHKYIKNKQKTKDDNLHQQKIANIFYFENFHRVLNVVCLLLGNSPASEFFMLTFRNSLLHLHRRIGMKEWSCIPIRLWRWNRLSVPKRRHKKFRRRRITQKRIYNIVNSLLTLSHTRIHHEWFFAEICNVKSSGTS
jgi:hypothetical protein